MKKAFVFDFDDTIATTDCKVIVRMLHNGVFINHYSLTPAEYNEHVLEKNEVYDFSEFKQLINPVPMFLLNLAKEVHNESHSVYILTARSSAVRDAVADFLCANDIRAKEIHCVGDCDGDLEIEKRKVLLTLLENYDRVYFYDDHAGNIKHAPESDKIRKYQVI